MEDMDDYNGGGLIDNDEQGIIQVGLNHHTLPIAFLRPPEKRLFLRQIGICRGSAEIASFWEQFAVKIL